jgi:hypothetical protein
VYAYLRLKDKKKVFNLIRCLENDFTHMAERDMKIKGINGRFPQEKHSQIAFLGRMLAMMTIKN